MAKGGRDQERWRNLKRTVAEDDGLPVRAEVGPWTYDKLWWWNRYIEITTVAMADKWKQGLAYVDLFAGPGVCTLKETGDRLPGSPLIAAQAPKPFQKIVLCEKNPALADACESRLKAVKAADRSVVVVGDCNDCITRICEEIPAGCLTLAFIDPTGLHAKFETIRKLTQGRHVDLLILFADGVDIRRNVEMYSRQEHSKLDDFLGPGSEWRAKWQALPNHEAAAVSRLFLEIYQDQLRNQLGYSVFGDEVVRTPQGTTLYRLMYASKHPRGLDFWKKSTAKFRDGPRLF